jgi:uncharacterized protein YyaL (SSP411 family)
MRNTVGQEGAPKFPVPGNLEFLLHYGFQYGDQGILDHVHLTLDEHGPRWEFTTR